MRVTVYQANRHPGLYCARGGNGVYPARVLFKEQRRHIRRLRSYAVQHPDIAWYERSLGLDAYRTDATLRTDHRGQEIPRCPFRLSRYWGISVAVVGPVGKLP